MIKLHSELVTSHIPLNHRVRDNRQRYFSFCRLRKHEKQTLHLLTTARENVFPASEVSTHTYTSKFSAPPDQAPAARPPFSLQPFACNQTAAGEFLNLSDPPAADEELEKMTQALPHCSETRRRQPGARRATTNGSVCCFPSQIPSPSASRDSPRPPPS